HPERILGHFGLAITSRVEQAGEEADLKVWYGFPDRARQSLVAVGSRETSQAIVLHYGEGLWTVAPYQNESLAVDEVEQARHLRSFGLRRALFLWPHGFDWHGEGTTRTAELGEIGGEIALLQAVLHEDDERPHTLRVLSDDGRVLATMRDVRWNKTPDRYGRHWPQELTLEEAGQILWKENIRTVIGGRFVDTFFVPLDRRGNVVGTPVVTARVVDLPAAHWTFMKVPEKTGIEQCLRLADAAIAARLEREPGAPLDRSPILALDGGGRPTGFWLSSPADEAPPEGWTERPAQTALGVYLTGPEAFGTGVRRTLGRAASDRGWTHAALLLRVRPQGEVPRGAEALLLAQEH
ncbi:MAG: hypothetical protein O2816_13695, partial [Planctomycetota bacterium]|nr:hypothetical protein [Planctomycetota bacterium]